jgi:hypothetical protein
VPLPANLRKKAEKIGEILYYLSDTAELSWVKSMFVKHPQLKQWFLGQEDPQYSKRAARIDTLISSAHNIDNSDPDGIVDENGMGLVGLGEKSDMEKPCYCVKCKVKTETLDPKLTDTKDGKRKYIRSQCKECGITKCRMVSNDYTD